MNRRTPNPVPDLSALPGAPYLAAGSLVALAAFLLHALTTPVGGVLLAVVGGLALAVALPLAGARLVRALVGGSDPTGPSEKAPPADRPADPRGGGAD